MARKRRWRSMPGRLSENLNGVSGVAGLGGAAFGVASWTLLAGTVAATLSGVGVVITAGAVGYAAWKAIPPQLKPAADLVGATLPLRELQGVAGDIGVISIIGPTQVGKTTLRNCLAIDTAKATRTQEVGACVVALQTVPPSYVAILDGGGEQLAQQFRIAEA